MVIFLKISHFAGSNYEKWQREGELTIIIPCLNDEYHMKGAQNGLLRVTDNEAFERRVQEIDGQTIPLLNFTLELR